MSDTCYLVIIIYHRTTYPNGFQVVKMDPAGVGRVGNTQFDVKKCQSYPVLAAHLCFVANHLTYIYIHPPAMQQELGRAPWNHKEWGQSFADGFFEILNPSLLHPDLCQTSKQNIYSCLHYFVDDTPNTYSSRPTLPNIDRSPHIFIINAQNIYTPHIPNISPLYPQHLATSYPGPLGSPCPP